MRRQLGGVTAAAVIAGVLLAACTSSDGPQVVDVVNHREQSLINVTFPGPVARNSNLNPWPESEDFTYPEWVLRYDGSADDNFAEVGYFAPLGRPVWVGGLEAYYGTLDPAVTDTLERQTLAGAPAVAISCSYVVETGVDLRRISQFVLVATSAGVAVLRRSTNTTDPDLGRWPLLDSIELVAQPAVGDDWLATGQESRSSFGNTCENLDLATVMTTPTPGE